MRRSIILGAALGLAGLCSAAPQAPATEEVPKRKPGLWEITTVAPITGMTTIRACVGADDDIVTPDSGDCTKPTVTPLNEGIIVNVVCTSKGGKQTISTRSPAIFRRGITPY